MSSVNKMILIGNVGKDPDVKFTPGGQAVANFTIACNESWKDKSGEKQERVEWVRIVAWGKLAELCGQYLVKGRQVYIEGKMQTREWTDKENVKKWTTEVVAKEVTFLGKGEGRAETAASGNPPEPSGGAPGEAGPGEDDIPF